jgi:glycerate-2-kinase
MPQPRSPLTLEGLREITNILLRAGADIHELNSVRKHLSIIKGGQLARYLQPARVVSLILSDVVGDDLDVIASGLTVPDSSTFKDADFILKKYNLWEKVPEEARSIIELGLNGNITDSPRIGDPIFNNVSNHVIGSNRQICENTAKIFRDRGLNVRHLTSYLEGESREVGYVIAAIIREMCYRREKYSIIMGGETTVKVKGEGKGGRNMETVLAVATKIKGLNGVAMASVGTDGIDGPTDAAGAICDGSTYYKSQLLNLKANDFLVRNDSYRFFEKVGGLIKTDPTGTNVNDIVFFAVI